MARNTDHRQINRDKYAERIRVRRDDRAGRPEERKVERDTLRDWQSVPFAVSMASETLMGHSFMEAAA